MDALNFIENFGDFLKIPLNLWIEGALNDQAVTNDQH